MTADSYKDGILPKPKNYAYRFVDLLTFHDAPTVIEQKLFMMFLEHRMWTFQGTYHAGPDYALWYSWSEMQRDLTEIKELAAETRRAGHVASVNISPVKTQRAPKNRRLNTTTAERDSAENIANCRSPGLIRQ